MDDHLLLFLYGYVLVFPLLMDAIDLMAAVSTLAKKKKRKKESLRITMCFSLS